MRSATIESDAKQPRSRGGSGTRRTAGSQRDVGHRNRLLLALPEADYARISSSLEHVPLRLGTVLYEPGDQMRHVYFPTTAIISLLYVMKDGTSAESAIVGNDGMIGVPLFMGGDTTSSRAIVHSEGHALRLRAGLLKAEFGRFGRTMRLLLRYTEAMMTQMAQNAVCNRYHSVDQQLCRWLLLNLDRLPSNELAVTHELIANTLGVRRESVTEAARKLTAGGLISHRRGRITVLDRPLLEATSCECYRVVRSEFQRLVPEAAGHARPA